MVRVFVFLLMLMASVQAGSAASGGLIRDAEIETALLAWMKPLVVAARLQPEHVKLYLIHDKSLNAFVSGGQNIYLYTGVLAESTHPDQVLGVFAHELGHIAGGHLARMNEDLDAALATQLIGFLVGIGTIAAGGVQAGAATLSASQHIAERGFLSSIRKREAAADQAGLRYLELSGKSPRGLVEFMTILDKRSKLYIGTIDPYTVTHPLTEERLKTLRHHLATSPYADVDVSAEDMETFQRLRAKVIGFLYEPEEVYDRYPRSDTSVAARYARAIAYFRHHKKRESFMILDDLIALEPDNGYFYELKGQFSFESGDIDTAVVNYRRALEHVTALRPLLQVALAQALVEKNDAPSLQEALDQLRSALDKENDNSLGWQLMSVVQGRLGNLGMSALAQAEKYILLQNYPQAIAQSQRAKGLLSDNEAEAKRRAQDIFLLASSLNGVPF